MFVDTDDLSLSMHLISEGYWEFWLTEVVAKLVKPGMTAVDIGANLGYFSLMMGELVGGGADRSMSSNRILKWWTGFVVRLKSTASPPGRPFTNWR